MNTLAKLVTETIDELERQNQPRVDNSGPKWQSDAERESLPVVNVHDDKGAPVLNIDATLRWEPGHLGRKE